jgi:sulfopyruvate decarboxylase TPP-binding subunit
VTAECDSLEMKILEYERDIRDIKDVREEKEVTVAAGGFSFKWFAFGTAAGMILMIIFFIIFKFK